MVVDKIPEDVVKDLIPLVNSLGNLPKTATVKYGATNFSYVPLDDIMAKIKADGNFAFMQPIGVSEDGRTCLQCVLYHKSGFPISSDAFPLPIKDGMKAQDVGAVLTYYRRYSASAFFGIASDEDNDGQSPEIASPKEKNLYLSFTASLYACKINSLSANAETSISNVDCGKWKLVINPSIHLNLYPG